MSLQRVIGPPRLTFGPGAKEVAFEKTLIDLSLSYQRSCGGALLGTHLPPESGSNYSQFQELSGAYRLT
jgi:hypothetical protein